MRKIYYLYIFGCVVPSSYAESSACPDGIVVCKGWTVQDSPRYACVKDGNSFLSSCHSVAKSLFDAQQKCQGRGGVQSIQDCYGNLI